MTASLLDRPLRAPGGSLIACHRALTVGLHRQQELICHGLPLGIAAGRDGRCAAPVVLLLGENLVREGLAVAGERRVGETERVPGRVLTWFVDWRWSGPRLFCCALLAALAGVVEGP